MSVNALSTSDVFPPWQLESVRKGRDFVGIPSVVGNKKDLLRVFPQLFVLLGDVHAREAAGSKDNQINQ